MRQSNYGSLGGRRSSNAAWQWIIIGLILGFACSAVVGLAGIAGGFLTFEGENTSNQPSVEQIALQATNQAQALELERLANQLTAIALTPTQVEQLVVEPTAVPTDAASVQQVQIATATLAPSPTQFVLEVEASATSAPTQAAQSAANGVQTSSQLPASSQSTIPDILIALRSEMVNVDGGTFQMGTSSTEVAQAVRECVDIFAGTCTLAMGEDSFPPHQVTVNAFRIEATEVTYEQYLAFLNSPLMGPRSHLNGCDGQPCLATTNESETSNVIFDSANYDVPDVINRHPVANVTWFGAKAYCQAIGRRLPTEAEWERAARGGDGRIYPWGSTFDVNLAKTNRPVPADPTQAGALPVGSYPLGASPYGVLDMAGNVGEWVSDWYSPNFYSQPEATQLNPIGPPAGTEKVVRGGSWDAVPFFARSVHRQSAQPNNPALWIGFRCVADPDTGSASTGTDAQSSGGGVDVFAGTPDPATLGINTEESLANSQPTLPPAQNVAPAGNNEPQPTLDPGGSS